MLAVMDKLVLVFLGKGQGDNFSPLIYGIWWDSSSPSLNPSTLDLYWIIFNILSIYFIYLFVNYETSLSTQKSL